MTMSRFYVDATQNHWEALCCILGYLCHTKDAAIRFRTGIPDYSQYPEPAYDWDYSMYQGVEEDIPPRFPPHVVRLSALPPMWILTSSTAKLQGDLRQASFTLVRWLKTSQKILDTCLVFIFSTRRLVRLTANYAKRRKDGRTEAK